VRLAISDAHAGLKAAIAKVLGCAWQRCTVHFLRDCLGHARRDQHGLLAALVRPIFNADSLAQARDRLSEAVAHLDGRLAKVATMLEDAEPDILAFYAFPGSHRRKLRSTNPLERFNKEIGRRTDVVGIFPNDRSLIRLGDALHRTKRRMAGRPRLPLSRVDLSRPRRTRRPHRQPDQQRGARAPGGLSSHDFSDEMSDELLHHFPGLDCGRAPTCCSLSVQGRRRKRDARVVGLVVAGAPGRPCSAGGAQNVVGAGRAGPALNDQPCSWARGRPALSRSAARGASGSAT